MLDILYRDDHLIAIHKPSGLLVHRSMLDRHETRFAVQLLRDQIGRHVYPAHRLDRGTSGILLFALDQTVASRLGKTFEQQAVDKQYLAIVRGHPDQQGIIDHPLSRRNDSPGYCGNDTILPPQPALTRYRRLDTVELPHAIPPYTTSRYALMELTPLTGRRHQLRRHMKHIAHPIIGDATFGKGQHNRLFAQLFGINRLWLACVRMRLPHPCSGKTLDLYAPPCADFISVMSQLGWGKTRKDWASHMQAAVSTLGPFA